MKIFNHLERDSPDSLVEWVNNNKENINQIKIDINNISYESYREKYEEVELNKIV